MRPEAGCSKGNLQVSGLLAGSPSSTRGHLLQFTASHVRRAHLSSAWKPKQAGRLTLPGNFQVITVPAPEALLTAASLIHYCLARRRALASADSSGGSPDDLGRLPSSTPPDAAAHPGEALARTGTACLPQLIARSRPMPRWKTCRAVLTIKHRCWGRQQTTKSRRMARPAFSARYRTL
jgi:hypothetical protein